MKKIDGLTDGIYRINIKTHTFKGPLVPLKNNMELFPDHVDISAYVVRWDILEECIYSPDEEEDIKIIYSPMNEDYILYLNNGIRLKLSGLVSPDIENYDQNKTGLFGDTDSIINKAIYKTGAEDISNVFQSFLENGFTREEALKLTMKLLEVALNPSRK